MQIGDFTIACLTGKEGIAASYSRNDMVLLAKDDPAVSPPLITCPLFMLPCIYSCDIAAILQYLRRQPCT